ncbi:SDR family oxidoreductase [Jidongwangia harbinensis]|uniref:SDR family oxidoreductase n=1 Tax=Jidongwangia harbinensis TaxID=2878561 RepID=UPI001CDA258B|nr:NAD(P)H-binding protein [Jidongwangia harbinensis]MCA2212761.1 NAD(P)H-binding protein [Jidongwangia harbinensis]
MTTTETVLITGASGTLGSAVLPRLVKEGHEVRPASRRTRPGWVTADLLTGAGLDEAVRGVDTVVHLASAPRRTRETDVEGTRRLLAAAGNAGVRHVVFISIIGIDRVPLPYYRLKVETEAVVRASGVPYTLLRAAQFPSLIDTVLTFSGKAGPLLIDRNLVFQPVAVEDVADRIAAVLAEGPTGDVVEVAGPETLRLGEMAGAWQRARGSRRPVWPIRIPGRLGREVRAGALTTAVPPTGTRTWRDYLAARY